MENYINYTAGGKRFSLSCHFAFDKESPESVAREVYSEISFDRDCKLKSGAIATTPPQEVLQKMSKEELKEWSKITDIEFYDYTSNKVIRAKHMSDLIEGSFKLESIG